ncbi:MAG: XdhC family protein [Anaerolineales bacterium]
MRDILPDLDSWVADDRPIALATVIRTWGSSPRGAGANMGITATGQITGSVSGGCVEGAVIEAGIESIQTGKPRLLHFGVADETAWEVGLACGGAIDVFVQPLHSGIFAFLREAIRQEYPAAVVTIIRGPEDWLGCGLIVMEGGEAVEGIPFEVSEAAREVGEDALAAGRPVRAAFTHPAGEGELFADVSLPPPELAIVGGVHISIALAKIAKVLGYRTIIVDPRRAFGNAARFPHADRLVQRWPGEALSEIGLTRLSAVAVLTHDPKLDDAALMAALPSPAFYVGALGSRKTQAKRRERLLEAGLTGAQLDRLHGPIGLDIGARTPEEIALAMMGEVVGAWNGGA